MTPTQLRISRLNKRWNQAQAAKFCNVTRTTYNRWENDRNAKGVPPHVAMLFGFVASSTSQATIRNQRHAVLKALGMIETEDRQGNQIWLEPEELMDIPAVPAFSKPF